MMCMFRMKQEDTPPASAPFPRAPGLSSPRSRTLARAGDLARGRGGRMQIATMQGLRDLRRDGVPGGG